MYIYPACLSATLSSPQHRVTRSRSLSGTALMFSTTYTTTHHSDIHANAHPRVVIQVEVTTEQTTTYCIPTSDDEVSFVKIWADTAAAEKKPHSVMTRRRATPARLLEVTRNSGIYDFAKILSATHLGIREIVAFITR